MKEHFLPICFVGVVKWLSSIGAKRIAKIANSFYSLSSHLELQSRIVPAADVPLFRVTCIMQPGNRPWRIMLQPWPASRPGDVGMTSPSTGLVATCHRRPMG